jgi:hypothetical protein
MQAILRALTPAALAKYPILTKNRNNNKVKYTSIADYDKLNQRTYRTFSAARKLSLDLSEQLV